MPNEFATEPKLPTPFPRRQYDWKDPITGLLVPKTQEANLKWRADLLAAAEEDDELQVDLYTACAQSVLFFVNAFAFTLRVFQPSDTGQVRQAENAHLPMVTWEIQDRHILRIEQGIEEGEDLLTDKSRDMGATWDHIVVYAHRLLFRDSESHLMISRKEDAVDILDGLPKKYPHGPLADPGTLFGKIDYILSRLPKWMLPRMSRKKMHLVNLDNGSRVDGESANATAGSSDRRTSIFLDEMAKMKEGESIKRSTRDVTACRLVCSTPNGAGTAYSKWRLSGMIPVFILPWWDHPEKGKGRYVKQDDLGRWKIHSPWYDHEEKRRSPKELAIEVDMDHVGSGDTFFEGPVLEEHRKLFAQPPVRTLTINFHKKVPDGDVQNLLARRDRKKLAVTPNGPWSVWGTLTKGRPDQTKSYVVSADISKGMGASNSVVNVTCAETREKVASFVDATTPPYELARIAVAACLWAGGRNRPLLIWENNGDPGFDFGRQVTHIYNYPNIYFDRAVGRRSEKVGKRYGWRSSPEKKAAALGSLRRAYAHGQFINHDAKALDEALTYIHYENGGIGPAELVEESASARKTHGDRVIADMLALVGIGDKMVQRRSKPIDAPTQTFAGRFEAWKRRQKARANTRRFDFNQTR
jgi:hypothetical protein